MTSFEIDNYKFKLPESVSLSKCFGCYKDIEVEFNYCPYCGKKNSYLLEGNLSEFYSAFKKIELLNESVEKLELVPPVPLSLQESTMVEVPELTRDSKKVYAELKKGYKRILNYLRELVEEYNMQKEEDEDCY